MSDLTGLTLAQSYAALREKKISSVELTTAYLTRIKSVDSKLNSFLFVNSELALKTAQKVDDLLARGEKLCWLSGIPGAVKDVISTKGLPTSAGSKILEGYIPPYDATVIDKLHSVHSPILGKTNLDEFAMGSSTENSAYGAVSNPWDITKVPGGSSGGSGAAVSADLCAYALGSDTGGSIRLPASFCGVVGLKPTYGRVSRYGLIAYGSSLDCIGPLTKTVKDSAYILNVIAGYDAFDSTSAKMNLPNFAQNLNQGIKDLRIGVPKEYFGDGLNTKVAQAIKAAIKKLESLGAVVVDINLPHSEVALSVYYITATSEASSNLSRYDGIHYGKTREFFGNEVKRRIILGTYALSSGYYEAYYLKAANVRTLIKKDFEKAFEKVDCIVGPVAPTVAFAKGAKSTPLEMYLTDIYTILANLAGIPSLSIPCGFVDNLPVGLQIMGKHFQEELILKVGHTYESATKWSERKPIL